MPERIEWLDDGSTGGSPYSPRFGDRYRSELGGLEQSREVFLKGCGLPLAWAHQQQWKILETGFGLGLNFLVTWHAWRADPLRPRLLHFVSTEAYPASADDVLRSAASHPDLLPLAQELKTRFWGLLPGFHRMAFDGGRVLLTLCIGDAKTMLAQQQFEADSVYLDGFSPRANPDIWDIHTMKAVARCCRRGARIATWTIARSVRDALAQAGFIVKKTPGIPPKRDNLQGEYKPHWQPKKPAALAVQSARQPSSCVVIGSGLAGAATAASLARRGWSVTVLDAANEAAAGASGLPAGVLAPHVSPDDSQLSRISRCGVRASLEQAETLLQAGVDCGLTGVMEHSVQTSRRLPTAWNGEQAAADWSSPASAEQLLECGLPTSAQALWHSRAGWIKPASLVKAWLATPGVEWRGNSKVASITADSGGWQIFDTSGQLLAQAEMVVIAAAYASRELAASIQSTAAEHQASAKLALQAIRGQVSWGVLAAEEQGNGLPAFPVNGHGSLIPRLPLKEGQAWLLGSSFERDVENAVVKPADHLENFARLKELLPEAAALLGNQFATQQVRAWAGVRCATPGRLPMVGRLATGPSGDVWVCSGMGSRGLTFAALCAELLAARLHGEPLPLERRLAQALMSALRLENQI
ncbi:MAG: FAD-dependent 5-carboxymethylaminomethyl-2-thiouridine(34) oxidoreductase MnmC [Pseudomonadota bacterium]